MSGAPARTDETSAQTALVPSDDAHRATDSASAAVDHDGASVIEVDLQGQDVIVALPAEADGMPVVGIDAEVAIECRVRVPEPNEIEDAADDGTIKGVLDLGRACSRAG